MGFKLEDALAQSQIVKEAPRFDGLKADRPEIAPPTTDPDRHTTYVPTDHTTLSLGQKFNKEDEQHIQDFGITGRTDRHVHFHVAKTNKTIVSLGGPATSVEIDSHDYHSCVRLESGTVTCWGNNQGHAFANDLPAEPWQTAHPIPVLGRVDRIFVGGTHTCALRAGVPLCAGNDESGAVRGAPAR